MAGTVIGMHKKRNGNGMGDGGHNGAIKGAETDTAVSVGGGPSVTLTK